MTVLAGIYKYPHRKGYLMNVTVSGNRSKKQARTLARAAEYYASLLMSKRTIETVQLEICLKKKLDEEVEGYCHFVESGNGYKKFYIELLKGYPIDDLLLNLAHEVVHLKQFTIGELNRTVHLSNTYKWQGKYYNEDKINYYDLPWEIEANGRERGLYYRFVEHYNG